MICSETPVGFGLAFMASLFLLREEDGQWKEDQKLEAHSDWVRDVGWAPSIGLPTSTIASCSQVRMYPFRHQTFSLSLMESKQGGCVNKRPQNGVCSAPGPDGRIESTFSL